MSSDMKPLIYLQDYPSSTCISFFVFLSLLYIALSLYMNILKKIMKIVKGGNCPCL